jgi:hypothetical protein
MKRDRVQKLLRQGEGQRLEFKQEAIKPSDLAETLVALANAQGGMVLLGVGDDGAPLGLRDYNRAFDLLTTAASREVCDPPIRLGDVEAVEMSEGVQVLCATVPRSRRLHTANGRFLIRRGSRNVALSTSEVAERSHQLAVGEGSSLKVAGGYQALYEVLSYAVTLELEDSKGQVAVLDRRQEIRFLQDGVVGIYDQVWGEGELIDQYEVEPGVVADRFHLGGREVILISLREIKNRGDVIQLHTRRRVRAGWTKSEEWLETTVSHNTHSIEMTVVFPRGRAPKSAAVTEIGSGRTTEIPTPARDAEGRRVLKWSTRQPQLGESYVLRWAW